MRSVAAVLLTVAALASALAARAADAIVGQGIYQSYCLACHGPAAANINNVSVGANNATAILLQMQKPASPMRYLLDLLTSTDIADVAAYLGVVFGKAGADTITPVTGLWWNPAESGSGYALDVKHGVLVVTVYSYRADGEPQWYLAAGPLTNNGRSFSATLDKYRAGQCISCAYTGRPTLAGNDGVISIEFASSTSATVTLPGGRVATIQPQDF